MTRRLLRRMFGVALATAFVAGTAPSRAARQLPTADDASALAAAWTAYGRGELETAERAFRQMLERGEATADELWQARGWLGIGSVATERLQYAEAVSPLRRALATFDRIGTATDIGHASLALATALAFSGSRADASPFFARAIASFDEAGDRRNSLRARYQEVRANTGAPDNHHRLAALAADARALGDRSLEAAALQSIGDRLFVLGDFDAAVGALESAASLLQGDVDAVRLGTIYNSLGRLYRSHGQTTAALDYQLRALAIHEKQSSTYAHVQSLNAVSVVYTVLGDYPRAMHYLERALERAGDAEPAILAFLRASYGNLLAITGDVARGRDMLAQSLDAASPFYRTMRGTQLAWVEQQLGNLERASAAIDAALSHCAEATRLECADARLRRADIAIARGDEAAALADQRAVLDMLEAQRASLIASDFMKQGFAELWTPTYSVAVRLLLRQGRDREALETAELGRARALLDLLATRDQSVAGAGVAVPAAGSVAPHLRRSDALARPARVADLVATAARLRSTLVVYWVGDDEVYAWTVAPDGAIHSAVTPLRTTRLAAMTRAIAAFGSADADAVPALVTRGANTIPIVMAPQPAWRDLYDALIQPIAAHLPPAGGRITIVPHGPLIAVPFAALRDRQGRYLLERYIVHTAPAGAFFDYTPRGAAGAAARAEPPLLVANPSALPPVAGERPLPPLPGADAEVRAIADLWPDRRATVLAGADATEARVLAETGRHSVLHFATHAIVRDTNPSRSFLALGRTGDDALSGALTPDKIYALSLDADLVVLSACRSGGGPPNGDGIAALVRAFISAGTPSVVASVWDVADEPTTRLLPAFYRAWLGGADKAAALRTAQLALIADLRAGRVRVPTRLGDVVLPEDPAFWAGFVLLGEAD